MTTNTDVHTCSYYCERPECIRRQRDELRDRMESVLASTPPSVPVGVDEAAAIRAFEEHFQASSDDPYFEGELELWLTAWRNALAAQQPVAPSEVAAMAHEIWAAAQLAPGEGIEDGVARVDALLCKAVEAGRERCARVC